MRYWIEKSDEEYFSDLKKSNHPILTSFLFFLFTFSLSLLMKKTGLGDENGNYISLNWEELLSALPKILIFSLSISIAVFLYLSFSKRSLWESPATVICKICFKVKREDENDLCECGGPVVHIKKMKWITEKKDKEKEDSRKTELRSNIKSIFTRSNSLKIDPG